MIRPRTFLYPVSSEDSKSVVKYVVARVEEDVADSCGDDVLLRHFLDQ